MHDSPGILVQRSCQRLSTKLVGDRQRGGLMIPAAMRARAIVNNLEGDVARLGKGYDLQRPGPR